MVWAAAIAAGIPNEVFWELTAAEVAAVLKERADEEERTAMLFGLVAATIVNVHRGKGSPMVQPGDFFRKPSQQVPAMGTDEAQVFMDAWAESVNNGQGVGHRDSPGECGSGAGR